MDLDRKRRIGAVIDTNVLLGAHRKQILSLASVGTYTLITSPYIIDELHRIMATLEWRDENRAALLQVLLSVAEVVDHQIVIAGNYDLWLTDPDDHPIMATALAGKADYLVTDNTRHFPPKSRFAGITIVTGNAFLRLLQR